jgi:hypothetical protein
MAININIDSQIVTQTISEWAIDTTIYVTNTLLFVSDSTYLFTNQQKFKKADGVNTFADLDFMPIDNYYVNSFKTRVDAHGGVTEALDCLDTQLEELDVTPSIMLTPNGVKDGKLFSIIGNTSQTDMDWSRNTVANRVNKNGLIEEVGVNVPRINYPISGGCPSVLLEPQRTNLITYSNDFSNVSWIKSGATIIPNEVISLDGSINASKIVSDNSLSSKLIYKSNIPVVIGEKYTFSSFVKKSDFDFIQIGFGGGFGDIDANINLSNGNIEVNSGISDVNIEFLNDDWFKISITDTPSTTVGFFYISLINSALSNRAEPFQGDGVSGIYIYGAQLELGSYATSPIPTLGATVTRLKDVGTNCGTVDDFNSEEGTFFVEMSQSNDTFNTISISDGTTSNRVTIAYINDSIRSIVVFGGVITQIVSNGHTQGQVFKAAIIYTIDSITLSVNGVDIQTIARSVFTSPLNKLEFAQGNGGNEYFGEIKQLHVYKQALTDAQIQAL